MKHELIVKSTSNYDLFNKKSTNRMVSDKHVRKIADSMKAYGYVGSPIVVNNNYEVIDGQHRLEACKLVGIPVTYTISDLGTEEMIALNNTSKSWVWSDYVSTYANSGNKSYKLLKEVCDQYNLTDAFLVQRLFRTHINDIKNGKFTCSEEYVLAVKDMVQCLTNRKNIAEYEGIPFKRAHQLALTKLLSANVIDTDRFEDQLSKYGAGLVINYINESDVLENFQELYNYRLSAKNRVYFLGDLRKKA